MDLSVSNRPQEFDSSSEGCDSPRPGVSPGPSPSASPGLAGSPGLASSPGPSPSPNMPRPPGIEYFCKFFGYLTLNFTDRFDSVLID